MSEEWEVVWCLRCTREYRIRAGLPPADRPRCLRCDGPLTPPKKTPVVVLEHRLAAARRALSAIEGLAAEDGDHTATIGRLARDGLRAISDSQ